MINNAIRQLSTTPFPILLVNKDGLIEAVNQPLANLLNVSTADIEKNYLFNYFIPLENQNIKKLNNDSHIYVFSNKHKNINNIMRLNINQNKNDDYFWVLLTKEKNWQYDFWEIEKELSRLTDTIAATNFGIWQYDITKKEATFSNKLKEIIHVSSDQQLTWQMFIESIYEDDKIMFYNFLNSHITSLIPLNFEFRMLLNNEIHWFSIKGETFFNNGDPICTMGTLYDCSHTKKLLHDLTNAIESNNIAMDLGKIGTWYAELNLNNDWLWSWDTLTSEMFALSYEDIGNFEKWANYLHPEDEMRVTSKLLNSLETGQPFSESFRTILASGETRYFIGKARVRKNSNGENYRIDGIFFDETPMQSTQIKLKKLNLELEEHVHKRTEELEHAKEHAEKASQIKTEFLSMMSHELRTPMNAVIGSLDLLQSTKQNYEAKDLIDTAKTSAENLVFILNDILDINKIEAGKLDIEELTFSISEIVDNVIKIFIPVAQKKNITLNIIESPYLPLFVKGDAMRVRQILFNLIGNALKFTTTNQEKKGVVTLIVDEIEKNDYVSNINFKISDNGIGIDKENQKNLFEPFMQAERSTTRKYGGTGLGLAICGKLSQMMGGRIILTSKIGQGTTFDVDIPFWKSQETRAMDITELDSIDVKIVTFTSDNKQRIERISAHLTKEGANVSNATSSLINIFQEKSDVIFVVIENFNDEKKQLNTLLSYSTRHQKIILAFTTLDFEQGRQQFNNIRVVNIEALTRRQLIEKIYQTKQQNLEIDIDDLDLHLDFNEQNDLTELDLHLDFNEQNDLKELDLDLDLNLSLDELTATLNMPIEEQKNNIVEQSSGLKDGILVVEDNPMNQKLIAMQLKNIGYHCDVADDGEDGKNKWLNGDYHLILTDCHMPKLDGYEMTRAIRSLEKTINKKTIPIIAVTGAAMTGDSKHCYDAGMNDFVSKPIQQADLRKILKKWYQHE